MQQPYLTIGDIARRFGVLEWQARRIFERRLLPPPARVGTYRVIPESDLPAVERALRTAGYLPAEAEAVAHVG